MNDKVSKTRASNGNHAKKTTDDKKKKRMRRKEFDRELEKVQIELCRLQEWVVQKGLRVVVVFEGRDAAGKGGVIKRITERVSPRVFRVVALPAPNERQKTQLYMQRYVPHFPAAGEVVLFDRSWYNRAGVEHVMGFCTDEEYTRFLNACPLFERLIVDDGIILIKYFFEVSQDVQEQRFMARAKDPRKRWKLSPIDLEARKHSDEYMRARDQMLARTDTAHAPWYVVDADDKRRARLNCIQHLLTQIPYEDLSPPPAKLDKRRSHGRYKPRSIEELNLVRERYRDE